MPLPALLIGGLSAIVPYLPTIAAWAIGKLPPNLSQGVGKAVGIIKSGVNIAQPVLNALGLFSSAAAAGRDITADELAAAETEMDAAYAGFKAHAEELRKQ